MSVYQRPHEHGIPGRDKQLNGEVPVAADDDDWETDADYVNDVGEKGQRYGSKLIQPLKADQLLDSETPNLQAMKARTEKINEEVLNEEYQKKRQLYGGK
ncbi:hypothetical protein PROFUN_02085 [Planoprotostelium fungivorum]|uniref:Uncharacterized protein n=1 Tax=Planoprotostelium fungivorum TaxID=1890364 RepID=A0A2P6NBD1_9EUKA|nr:hypothetical protein PROFUN_02085 [Planoprotostelium fungivorum]